MGAELEPERERGEKAVPRVTVDEELCIGAGNCVRLAPSGFALNADDIAVVTEPGAATSEQLLLAQRSCPSGAIFLDPAEFGSSSWPAT